MFGLKRFSKDRYLHVSFDKGNSDKETIVFLHGLAATSATWLPVQYKLNYSKYRVIALDLLGFGRSPKPENAGYTAKEHAEYVRRTLKSLDVKKPFILVGHSMGSLIAANYSYQWPEDIKYTVLVGTPLYYQGSDQTSKSAKRLTNFYMKAYNFILNKEEFTVKNSQRLRKLLKISDGIDVTNETWRSFRLSLINTINHQNTYNEIKDSKVRFHLVYGNLDEFVVKDSLKLLAKLDNVEEYVIKGSDHQVDDKIARRIAKIIDKS